MYLKKGKERRGKGVEGETRESNIKWRGTVYMQDLFSKYMLFLAMCTKN